MATPPDRAASQNPPATGLGPRYDLVVVGAGINGAGIARDAAARGLSVLLLDKGDIGSGTSSWSTRLIHGGLRYLEHFEFSLVRESLREREHILHAAPHLVKPLPLLIPIYKDARHGPMTVWAGMVAYDLLSWDKSLPRHRMLSGRTLAAREPGLNREGLRGGALYFDAQVELAERLVLENALAARAHGARVLTYTQVTGLIVENGAVTGVYYRDVLDGSEGAASAALVVNVAGPWVDEVLRGAPGAGERLIGGTKGSHLVVKSFPGAPRSGLYLEAEADHRPFFIIPWAPGAGLDHDQGPGEEEAGWGGRPARPAESYLIGTTDIPFTGDPGAAAADDDEIQYLLRETNRVIPRGQLERSDVLYTYSGVRPLPYEPGVRPGAVTRRHIIHEHRDALPGGGLISVVGGKLTTYRSLAEEVVDRALRLLGRAPIPCPTRALRLPGANGECPGDQVARLFEPGALPAPRVFARLCRIYGSRALDILRLIEDEPALAEPLAPQSGALAAEVVFAFRAEMARTLEDVLARRTMVGLGSRVGLDVVEGAARAARRWLGWDDDRARREVEAYRRYVRRFGVRG